RSTNTWTRSRGTSDEDRGDRRGLRHRGTRGEAPAREPRGTEDRFPGHRRGGAIRLLLSRRGRVERGERHRGPVGRLAHRRRHRGPAGTGKSIRTTLVCAGIVSRDVGSVLSFDMHGEYGVFSATDHTEGLNCFCPGRVEIRSLGPKTKEPRPFVLAPREITPEDLIV